MMDNWRRQRSDNRSHELTRTRSYNRKPPLGNWQPTVPSWEKKFCNVIGSVPWQKVLDTKKYIHLYDDVLKWNDSAGEEAFHNAKSRFWAKINGLPCDISLPDPDIYIDMVDWNSDIDPELLLDLEREFVDPQNQEKGEQVVIIGQAYCELSPTGWGDLDDNSKKSADLPWENKADPWENDRSDATQAIVATGWGDSNDEIGWNDGLNNSRDWNQLEGNNYEIDEFKDRSAAAGDWGNLVANNRKGERNASQMPRYRTSRFHGDDCPRDWEQRNWRGRKRVNFVYEQPYMGKWPGSRQWNLTNSCEPISH